MIKMSKKTVFLPQAFCIAHGKVMALDEDATTCGTDDSGGRERSRTGRDYLYRFTESGKAREQRAHFGKRQRWPVWRYQRAIHTVYFWGRTHLSVIFGARQSS
jgi:hypothetical protein